MATYVRERYQGPGGKRQWSGDDIHEHFDKVRRSIPYAQCVDARDIQLSPSQSAAKNLEMLNRVLPAVTEKGYFIDLAGLTIPISPFGAGANLKLRNGTLDFTDAGATTCISSTGGSIGTDLDLSSNAATGDLTIALDSVSGLAVGDWLRIISDEDWDVDGDFQTSEKVRIRSISGTTVTLYDALDYSYTTANNARAAKITHVDGWHFRDIVLVGNPDDLMVGMRPDYLKNAVLANCVATGFRSRAFSFDTGLNIELRNPVIGEGDPDALGGGFGYGVAFLDGCHDCRVIGGSAHNQNHAVTIGGSVLVNRHISVIGMHSLGCTGAGLDSHRGADWVTFENFQVHRRSGSTTDGVISQAARTTIKNGLVTGPGGTRNAVLWQPLMAANVPVKASISGIIADGTCGRLVYVHQMGTRDIVGVNIGDVQFADRGHNTSAAAIEVDAEAGGIKNVNIGGRVILDEIDDRGIHIHADTGRTIVGGSIIGGRIRVKSGTNAECIHLNGADADSVTDFVIDGWSLENGDYGVRAPTTAGSVNRIVLGPSMVYSNHATANFRITGAASKITQQQEVSDDNGDAAKTLTIGIDEREQVWSTELTADRAVTLSTTGAVRGAEFHIVRPATGAFNLNVGTGPLKALAAGEECWVRYNGSAWYLSAAGSL